MLHRVPMSQNTTPGLFYSGTSLGGSSSVAFLFIKRPDDCWLRRFVVNPIILGVSAVMMAGRMGWHDPCSY